MKNKYVLLLCPILKDGKDIGGNLYRGAGELIQAKVFNKDGNIDTGLYGILWGKRKSYHKKVFLKSNWAIVKTEVNHNLLSLDRDSNEMKFKRGIILHMGKLPNCVDYLMNIKDDETHGFSDEAKELTKEQIIAID